MTLKLAMKNLDYIFKFIVKSWTLYEQLILANGAQGRRVTTYPIQILPNKI